MAHKNLKLLFFAALFFLSAGMSAQEKERIENVFQGTRLVNGQSANLVEKGELQLLIQHRFGDISEGYYELFGLDQASMRLGFEYGFGENFNLGLGRSTWLKTYDAFTKVRLLGQTTGFPFSAVVSVGGSLPTVRNYYPESNNGFSDRISGNVQLHLSKTTNKFGFQVSPGFLKTGFLTNSNKNLSLFTLGTAGSFSLSEKVSLNLEYLVPFSEELNSKNVFSLGLDLDTGGHLFQLVLSNNQRMYHQGMFTSTFGNWQEGKVFFGFNLIREFDINKPLEF